jgi:polyvinyl alcohol dehydrogenase (cytochrome)
VIKMDRLIVRSISFILIGFLNLGGCNGTGGESIALWLVAGQNLSNTRHQKNETKIDAGNVKNLSVKWVFTTGGDVSATPAVDESAVYVPDWAGNLFKIDRETGSQIWSRKISDYTGIPDDVSRTTPVVYGDMLIFGNQGGGAHLMAVNKDSGDLIWVRKVDDHAASIITQSAVVHDDRVYVGVSSLEWVLAASPEYPCCTFRGSVLALDSNNGEILWRTYTAPLVSDFPGYSGSPVWGSTPVVDPKRSLLYIATGNNYTVPEKVLECVEEANKQGNDPRICNDPGNLFDAIVALDLESGSIVWGRPMIPFDAWNLACITGGPNCQSSEGVDFDFGQGPILFSVRDSEGTLVELLGAGQKSGKYWALDPDDGEVVWDTQVGPGGLAGGHQWGSATDGERIYTAISNSDSVEWELIDNGEGTGKFTDGGFWSALDAATGEILWQTPDPNIVEDQGAVTSANGVVFAGSLAPEPDDSTFFALDAASGDILWEFASGASVNSGPAVVGGIVYWGSGYARVPFGEATGNNKLYAFEVR